MLNKGYIDQCPDPNDIEGPCYIDSVICFIAYKINNSILGTITYRNLSICVCCSGFYGRKTV